MSSRPDCIFEIHQLWQSGFSRLYSNSCCSCSFQPEIIKIGQSSYKMYSNNILNFQESMPILNACTKKSGNLLNTQCIWELFFIKIFSNAEIFVSQLRNRIMWPNESVLTGGGMGSKPNGVLIFLLFTWGFFSPIPHHVFSKCYIFHFTSSGF